MEFSHLNHQSQAFILLLNVKMPTIVGILTFMSWVVYMLSRVEHENSSITSGPGLNEISVITTVRTSTCQHNAYALNGPRCEKTGLCGFRPV